MSNSASFGVPKDFNIPGLSLPALAAVQVDVREITLQKSVAGIEITYKNIGATTGGHPSEKIFKIFFSKNDPSRSKNMREFEFDIFKAKNASLIQGRPVFKRKVDF